MRICSLLSTVVLLSPLQAQAFCSEPIAPSPPWGDPPSAPYCYNEWDKTHTCESWEIDSWIDEINSFIDEMATYADEAQDFASYAVDFANCRIREAKEPLQ